MNRNISSAVVTATAGAAAILAVSFIAAGDVRADDITVDATPFVSSMTRGEVIAQLKVPYPGGNPWSGQYNMFQIARPTTSDQVSRDYVMSRDEVHALTGEDSGSSYLLQAGPSLAKNTHGLLADQAR